MVIYRCFDAVRHAIHACMRTRLPVFPLDETLTGAWSFCHLCHSCRLLRMCYLPKEKGTTYRSFSFFYRRVDLATCDRTLKHGIVGLPYVTLEPGPLMSPKSKYRHFRVEKTDISELPLNSTFFSMEAR
jgi:hypothetical protein